MATFLKRTKGDGTAEADRFSENNQLFEVYKELCESHTYAGIDAHLNQKSGTAYRRVKNLNEIHRQNLLYQTVQAARFTEVIRSLKDISEDPEFYAKETEIAVKYLEGQEEEVRKVVESIEEMRAILLEDRQNGGLSTEERENMEQELHAAFTSDLIRAHRDVKKDANWRTFIAKFNHRYPMLEAVKGKRGRTKSEMASVPESILAELSMSFNDL